MTDSEKRKPAGAAVPGYVERPINYGSRLNTLIQTELHDAIEVEFQRRKAAGDQGATFSSVAREWLWAGKTAQDERNAAST